MWTTDDDIELITGVFSSFFSVFNLPSKLFEYTFNSLIDRVEKGFKGGIDSIPPFTPKHEIAVKMRENINVFSGAKTFQNVKDLSNFVFLPDGSKRPFKEFKEMALKINAEYNINWLKTEQDAAFMRSISAEKWQEIQAQKDILPLLKWNTVGDARVRDEHKALEGIVKPVDDKFWDTYYPPIDWGCRCDVDQLDEGEVTNLEEHLKEYNKNLDKPLEFLPKPIPLFSDNPGKSHLIFLEDTAKKHPYFKVEQKYKVIQNDNNFQLGYL